MDGERAKLLIDAEALRDVLQALNGPDHYIRELQFTRGGAMNGLCDDNPIDILIKQYNEWVESRDATDPGK